MTDVDRVNCVAYIDGIDGPYGYTPRFAAGVVFCVLFGISMLLHTYTSVRYRTWWQLVFAVGALGMSSSSRDPTQPLLGTVGLC